MLVLHPCGLKVCLLLPKCATSALPCLVRELCEPATRSLQLIQRPVYWAVKLDFFEAAPDTNQSNHFAFVKATGQGQAEMESCPKLTHLSTQPLFKGFVSSIQAISFIAHSSSSQFCSLSNVCIRNFMSVETEMICSQSPFNFISDL